MSKERQPKLRHLRRAVDRDHQAHEGGAGLEDPKTLPDAAQPHSETQADPSFVEKIFNPTPGSYEPPTDVTPPESPHYVDTPPQTWRARRAQRKQEKATRQLEAQNNGEVGAIEVSEKATVIAGISRFIKKSKEKVEDFGRSAKIRFDQLFISGEHTTRNRIIAGGVGAVAVIASAKWGVDVMGDGSSDVLADSFDNGLDTSPTDPVEITNPAESIPSEATLPATDPGTDPTLGDQVVPPEIQPTPPEAFIDAVQTGDGVTDTIHDYALNNYGVELSPEQLGDVWSDMSTQHSPEQISQWFPGSSVTPEGSSFEWSVGYSDVGPGGITAEGTDTIDPLIQSVM